MFPRSEAAALEACRILALCLDDRAPFGLIDFFTSALMGKPEGEGRDATAGSISQEDCAR
jgi:hypothetical protein